MVQTCSAYGCKNRYHKDKDVSFHKFPLARPDVCDKWVSAMRRNNFKPTKYSNICSQHFTTDCFKRECNNRVLKESAVPSLFTFNLSIKVSCSQLSNAVSIILIAEEPDTCSDTQAVCCDHNYTAEDSPQQKKRLEQLEEQLQRVRKKLKTMQQKCRRQERQLKRLKAGGETNRGRRKAEQGEGAYIILPRHYFNLNLSKL
uniref:THAP domain-containing protein 1-like n=1 Tax=Gouania willdenowi TaxID=441366 RepID=A0A8C5DLD4_GOUWI